MFVKNQMVDYMCQWYPLNNKSCFFVVVVVVKHKSIKEFCGLTMSRQGEWMIVNCTTDWFGMIIDYI